MKKTLFGNGTELVNFLLKFQLHKFSELAVVSGGGYHNYLKTHVKGKTWTTVTPCVNFAHCC